MKEPPEKTPGKSRTSVHGTGKAFCQRKLQSSCKKLDLAGMPSGQGTPATRFVSVQAEWSKSPQQEGLAHHGHRALHLRPERTQSSGGWGCQLGLQADECGELHAC